MPSSLQEEAIVPEGPAKSRAARGHRPPGPARRRLPQGLAGRAAVTKALAGGSAPPPPSASCRTYLRYRSRGEPGHPRTGPRDLPDRGPRATAARASSRECRRASGSPRLSHGGQRSSRRRCAPPAGASMILTREQWNSMRVSPTCGISPRVTGCRTAGRRSPQEARHASGELAETAEMQERGRAS